MMKSKNLKKVEDTKRFEPKVGESWILQKARHRSYMLKTISEYNSKSEMKEESIKLVKIKKWYNPLTWLK